MECSGVLTATKSNIRSRKSNIHKVTYRKWNVSAESIENTVFLRKGYSNIIYKKK